MFTPPKALAGIHRWLRILSVRSRAVPVCDLKFPRLLYRSISKSRWVLRLPRSVSEIAVVAVLSGRGIVCSYYARLWFTPLGRRRARGLALSTCAGLGRDVRL
jgi:hypothetical protein